MSTQSFIGTAAFFQDELITSFIAHFFQQHEKNKTLEKMFCVETYRKSIQPLFAKYYSEFEQHIGDSNYCTVNRWWTILHTLTKQSPKIVCKFLLAMTNTIFEDFCVRMDFNRYLNDFLILQNCAIIESRYWYNKLLTQFRETLSIVVKCEYGKLELLWSTSLPQE